MGLFEVYSLLDLEPVKAKGAYLWDKNGDKYLDFYGGHAVISIGHSHPVYVEKMTRQLNRIGFYSNAVRNPLQDELALLLGKVSGYPEYNLFLCNSGAEANENALKLASFITDRSKILAMRAAFHGRTSVAVAVTDNPAIQAPLNRCHEVTFIGCCCDCRRYTGSRWYTNARYRFLAVDARTLHLYRYSDDCRRSTIRIWAYR